MKTITTKNQEESATPAGLPERLRALRKAKDPKLSIDAAAAGSGVGARSLAAYETGERKPKLDQMLKLASYYQTDLAGLFK